MDTNTKKPQQMATLPQTAKQTMEVINSTPVDKIPELDFVKNKYISNYNACHPTEDGELMYHRNLVFIKQAIAGFKDKQGATIAVDPFSVYACITTMAVYGYSAAPIDEEVYLYPLDGKMFLQRRAGAYVKRLITTGQIASVLLVNLVYEGDDFKVVDGFIPKGAHVENFASDIIKAGYIKFLLPDGREKHTVYRPSHWQSWRAHSPQPNGPNWQYETKLPNGDIFRQPKPGFLITKIISHACQEKSWTPGRTPAAVEVYSNVFIEKDDSEDTNNQFSRKQITANQIPVITPHENVPTERRSNTNNDIASQSSAHNAGVNNAANYNENSFAETQPQNTGSAIVHEDENF